MKSKATRPTRRSKAHGNAAESEQTWSYSIRLTEAERKLVFDAAELKAWTPTSLIKLAVLERAAAIVNTSRPNRGDFEWWIQRLGKQLCEPSFRVHDVEGAAHFESRHPDEPDPGIDADEYFREQELRPCYFTTVPEPLKRPELVQLREALRLGGAEFVARILSECDVLLRRQENLQSECNHELPMPVDPAKLG